MTRWPKHAAFPANKSGIGLWQPTSGCTLQFSKNGVLHFDGASDCDDRSGLIAVLQKLYNGVPGVPRSGPLMPRAEDGAVWG